MIEILNLQKDLLPVERPDEICSVFAVFAVFAARSVRPGEICSLFAARSKEHSVDGCWHCVSDGKNRHHR